MVQTRVTEQPSDSLKNANILLAGLIASYAVVVCSLLGELPLWMDEILQIFTIRGSAAQVIQQVKLSIGASPLGYFVHALFVNTLGYSPVWARLPSAIFSTLSCVGIVWLARRLQLQWAGAAVIVFMTLPLQFRYALEGRPYSQALFLGILSTILVLRVAEKPGPFRIGLYCLVIVLGVYTLPNMTFVPLGHLVWVLCCLAGSARRRAFLHVSVAIASAGALYAPWFLYARSSWIQAIAASPGHFQFTLKTPLMLLREAAGGGYLVTALLLIAAGFGVVSRQVSRSTKGLLLSIVAVPIMGPLILDAAFDYVLAIRQMIFMLPGLVLLAAEGLRELYDRRHSAGMVLFAGILAAALTYDVHWFSRPRENWQIAASLLKADARDSCVLFIPADAVSYYSYFEPELASCVCDQKQPFPANRRIIVAIPPFTSQADTKPLLDRLRAAGMTPVERKAAGGTRMLFYERMP